MNQPSHYICPICKQPLTCFEKACQCNKGHSFDIAGKGYVHLLPSHEMNSKDPGDSKEMVRSRRRFLDHGYYKPLSECLNELVLAECKLLGNNTPVILDAGCGEGYYTGNIYDHLARNGFTPECYGLDISKEAVRAASGRSKSIHYAVASLFNIPIANHSADIILNAFAPACDHEFKRVLKQHGKFICVIPGKDHLFELKKVLYAEPYANDEKPPELGSFKLVDTHRVKATTTIKENGLLTDLLAMTPYFWRTPKEGVEKLKAMDSLEMTFEFIILVYSL